MDVFFISLQSELVEEVTCLVGGICLTDVCRGITPHEQQMVAALPCDLAVYEFPDKEKTENTDFCSSEPQQDEEAEEEDSEQLLHSSPDETEVTEVKPFGG